MDSTLTVPAQPDGLQRKVLVKRDLTLGLMERIRLILRGGSVVDWYRLGFSTVQEVRDFLTVNGFLCSEEGDVDRVRDLLRMAADYLKRELDIAVQPELWSPDEIEHPFLVASDMRNRLQRDACILLKVVHTINHFQARELRMALSLPEVEVFSMVEEHVERSMNILIGDGYPIALFTSSRKSKESTVTKLLSKRRATATQILDRLRFRVVVDTLDNLPIVLAAMTQRLVPYNYVVPEETTNDVLDFKAYVTGLKHLQPSLGQLQFELGLESHDPLRRDFNECSVDEFRMLNFVIDWPLRIPHTLARAQNAHLRHLGHLIFLNVEFQVFDSATWEANEKNQASSHDAYKERQRNRVRVRLFEGLEGRYTGRG